MDAIFTRIKDIPMKKGFVLIPLACYLTFIMIYATTEKGFIAQSLVKDKVDYPPPGLNGNSTGIIPSKVTHKNGKGIFNASSKWIYRLNYTTLMESPWPTFLPHYRTPCVEAGSSILCLPSVYLAGMPKSGTTDLYYKLLGHPEILAATKEPHYWTRARFMYTSMRKLGKYMKRYYRRASREVKANCHNTSDICYHSKLIVDASACTFWDNFKWKLLPGNKNKEEPVILNAHHIRHLTPGVKIIVIFRNPIDRLYSDYYYFNKKAETSANGFHIHVKKSIELFSECTVANSPRNCVYNKTLRLKMPIKLLVGLYSIYVNDWFSIFPREQFHFISLEEYSSNKERVMKSIFEFLSVGPAPANYYKRLTKRLQLNRRNQKDRLKGEMRNDTRRLLSDFYKPFNRHLVETLKDKRFAFI